MELMARKNDDYLSHIAKMDESEILPDVAKTLNFLIKEKQPIALGSASKNAREILKKVNLYDKFDTIVDGNDVTEAKPNPEVFLIAANQLGMKPEDCIVFEDSVAGVQAANTANMISVGIGQQEILHKANDVFTDFAIMGIVYIQELINK
jgi:beta-phosphoglucomutase